GFSLSIFEEGDFKPPPIIFTTAYSQYAIRAFEYNSISYLLKPIKQEALQHAIEKFYYAQENKPTYEDPNYKQLVQHLLKPYKERFLVKTNQKLETIQTIDISYFFSEDKLTFLMLKSGQSKPIDFSLKQLEEQLNPSDFYRINRKYLIHHSSIKEMFYASKSKIQVQLHPANKHEKQPIFVAIEKIGQFKKWLS
ncbi:MAG: LytTR family DNA-binding domain-containing protein, partial [Bacteroidota bacterium]